MLKELREVLQRQVGQRLAQMATQFNAVYQREIRAGRGWRKS